MCLWNISVLTTVCFWYAGVLTPVWFLWCASMLVAICISDMLMCNMFLWCAGVLTALCVWCSCVLPSTFVLMCWSVCCSVWLWFPGVRVKADVWVACVCVFLFFFCFMCVWYVVSLMQYRLCVMCWCAYWSIFLRCALCFPQVCVWFPVFLLQYVVSDMRMCWL